MVGIIVGAVGCFLPWTDCRILPSDVFMYARLGFGVNLGFLALIALIFAGFSQFISMTQGKQYTLFFTFIGGLVGLWATEEWIGQPGAFEPYSWVPVVFTALYGAYVTFAGTLLASAGITLSLTLKAERSRRKVHASSF